MDLKKSALIICLLCLLLALCWLLAVKNLWMFYLFGIVIFSSTIGGTIDPFMAGYIFDETTSYKIVFF
ncbi:MAG: hypothetical protein GY857_20125 [Desulfobacula sp.]|nr:hypothetical protein [Desulfobacula sp.]